MSVYEGIMRGLNQAVDYQKIKQEFMKLHYTEEEAELLAHDALLNTSDSQQITAEESTKILQEIFDKFNIN